MRSTHPDDPLLNARETSERLGIKPDTLYAYVSRGLLRSFSVPGSRERRYRARDVERFRVQRGKRGHGEPEMLAPIINSAICLIEGGRFYYRGSDAVLFAETATLEQTAALLWNGAPPSDTAGLQRHSKAKSPSGLIERCQIRLAELAANDVGALDLTLAGVVRTGQTILLELVGCLCERPARCVPVHEQLAAFWQLDLAGANLIRRCLVLLADHELNASTFVARCIASTGATPYAVVSGALSALSGRRHGGASARAEALFREIGGSGDPTFVMAARLARDESLPGLGHPLYPDGDPRATAIISAVDVDWPEAGARIASAATGAMRLTSKHPNVDFALGAAVTVLGLPVGAALSIFLVARTVGWIAHAIEQYESSLLIRPRAHYTGRRPRS